jgi:hypothetical protein
MTLSIGVEIESNSVNEINTAYLIIANVTTTKIRIIEND